MKQVEVRLNISAVAPLLDIIKQVADGLRGTLAIKATFPEHDADFNETWTKDLLASQNSDIRGLLGLFDSEFFSEGAISINAANCESLLRGCSALRLRILERWLREVPVELIEDEDTSVESIPHALRVHYAAYVFLDQIQKIILEHLNPSEAE